jgi:hypothetical protein
MSRGLQRLPSYCVEHSEIVCLASHTEPNHILVRCNTIHALV